MTPAAVRRSAAAVAVAALAGAGAAMLTEERRAQPPMSADLRLHVRRDGNDVCRERQALLIHGLGGSGGYFANRLGSLPDDFAVVAPDLLGFGLSPKPLDASYTVDQHADVLLATLAPELEGRKTTIVGHSFGAVLALALVDRRPELFDAAVLISLPVFESRAEGEQHARRLGAMEAGILDDSAFWRASCLAHSLYRVPPARHWWDVPEDVYLDGTRHVWESLSRTLDHVLDVDAAALARRAHAQVPLVFVHGRKDAVAPVASVVALAHELDARLVVVAGAGHQVFLDDPERVWRIVREAAPDASDGRAASGANVDGAAAPPVTGDWATLTAPML